MPDPQLPQRLPDEQVGETLGRLDELLAQVEQTPGPAGEIAVEAVSALAHVYGEALARALGIVSDASAIREAFVRDELLGHLLVLHDLHPDSLTTRVGRVIRALGDQMQNSGADLTLAGIEDGVATIHVSARGCGSSTNGIADAVREAVWAMAPELSDVRVEPTPANDGAFIPVSSLTTALNGAHP